MTDTPNASLVRSLLLKAGATPYVVSSGHHETKKVVRYCLRNARPIVLEIDRQNPNLWILVEHELKAFKTIGKHELYPKEKGRHSHLSQVREFIGKVLIKVSLDQIIQTELERAIDTISGGPATKLAR